MNARQLYFIVALFTLHGFAAEPADKVPPLPSQGTISPSGAFTPANETTDTNKNVPRTPDEAEAALKEALNLKQTGANTYQIGLVVFDKQKRTVTVPASVRIRDQVVEYALVTIKGKTYESVLATEASPVDIQLAVLLLGVGPAPILGGFKEPAPVPDTNALKIDVIWETNGLTTTVPLSKLVRLTDGSPNDPGRPMSVDKWLYNGSQFDRLGFAAQREGSLVALIRDPVALVNNPGTDRDNDAVHLPNTQILPGVGTPVNMVLHLSERPPPPPPIPLPGVTPITPLSTNQY